jgi:uncharacterized membrane protein
MNFLFPLLSALLQASSFTLDKFILSIKRVGFQHYIGVSFPLIFVISLVIFFVSGVGLPASGFSGLLLLLLLLSVLLAVIVNIIYYRALDADKLSVLEPIDLLSNIPTILLAALIFSGERSPAIILLGAIASLAVLWAHVEKHHLKFAKYSKPFFFYKLTIAPFGAIISLKLLEVWNPISLEMVRSGLIALVMLPLFWSKLKSLPHKSLPYLIITNILTTAAFILYYFSFQRLGIVHTILIFSLQPILVYLFALIFLKEKFKKKNFIAFIIVLISIILAQIVSKA